MKKFYGNFINYPMFLTLIFMGNIAISVMAQPNELLTLPYGNSVKAEFDGAMKNLPIFKQAFTNEKNNLTEGVSLPDKNFPIFNQNFSQISEQLSDTKLSLKSAKKASSSLSPASGSKDLLSVGNTANIQTLKSAITQGPVGTPDHYAVPTDKILSIAAPGFLSNDIDLDGESLTATLITDAADHGTLAAYADGSFTYTPNADFVGTDQFSYQMRDASDNYSEATVTIEVLPAANRNPIGIPDSYAMIAGTTLSINAPGFLLNDIDLDGEELTATYISDNVDNGTLTAYTDGHFNYTPNPGFVGTDQFAYQMRDASGNISEATVTIEVYAANRNPVGMPDNYATIEGNALIIDAPGFLGNDIDLDGEELTATYISDNVDNGTLTAYTDGHFNYTPNAGFTGTDQFSYQMRDASGNDSEPVTVTIVVSSAGTTPLGMPDNYAIPSDQVLSISAPGFLGNDIDLDGEVLTATYISDNVDNGTLAAYADGHFNYTPNAGFTGTDQFSYQMRDASDNYSEATVTIEVLPAANRNPFGTPDNYAMLAGTTLSISAPGFLGNDIDLDGEVLTATYISDNVDNGTLAAYTDGHFNYTPNPGFVGTDLFAYQMRDASGNFSEPVTVTIEVYEENRAPIGVDDQYAALMNSTLSIAAPGFLANDIDLDGEALVATLITDAADHGTLAAFADGSFTYTPNADFVGTDQFAYQMRDASDNYTGPVTVTIEVYYTNQKPVADAGENQTIECDGSEFYTITLDGSLSSDPEDDPLIYTWRLNGEIIAGPSSESTAEIQLAFGYYEIELTVEDIYGEIDTDILVVSIVDTTPPAIQAPEDYIICMEKFPESLTATWTDNCLAGGELTATGQWFSATDCTTTWSYSFYVTDDAGNVATETVYVTRETEVFSNCETAYAYLDGVSMCFMEDKFKNWGWTNYLEPSETSYTMELYAAAGQCDINKGYKAGTVEVYYFNNEVTVTYHLFEGYVMHEAHVFIGCDKYPVIRKKETVSPGNYTYNAGNLDKTNNLSVTFTDVDGGIYLIAHATICEILCECTTTEYASVSDEMYLGMNCNLMPDNEKSVSFIQGNYSDLNINLNSAKLSVYPNPFSDKVNFEFTSNENANATLVIYNALGQKVKILLDKNVSKGVVNTISFIPENQVSGVYIYQLKLNGNVQTGKVVYNPKIQK